MRRSKKVRDVAQGMPVPAKDHARYGKIIICPYCQTTLSNSEHGVKSHLRTKHVKDGSLKTEEVTAKCNELLGRVMRAEYLARK